MVTQARTLANDKQLSDIPSTLLSRLLTVLSAHLKQANGLRLHSSSDETSIEAQNILVGLDAVSISLLILGADDMPKELYQEEWIDEMVDYIRFHLVHNIFVFFDAAHYQIHRAHEGVGFCEDDICQAAPTQRKKRRKNASLSRCHQKDIDSSSNNNIPKVVYSISSKLSMLLGQLANLLLVVRVPDAITLQLTSFGLSVFTIDNIFLLQNQAIKLVVAAFRTQPKLRGVIMDNLMLTLLKMPSSGRGIRRYMLPDDETPCIQMITAVLASCIQSSVTFSAGLAAGGDEQRSICETETVGYAPAFHWSHTFWKELLNSWQSAKDQEIDIKGLIQNLVTDLLTLLKFPEWPVASLLLLCLCSQLLSSCGICSTEIRIREFALDLLGQISARLKNDSKTCESDNILGYLARNTKQNISMTGGRGFAWAVDAARADVATTLVASNHCGVPVAFSEERFVLEAILLRYVHMQRPNDPVLNSSEQSALTFLFAQLAREADRHGTGFRSGVPCPGAYRVAYQKLYEVLNSSTEADLNRRSRDSDPIPRAIAVRLFRAFSRHLPLAQQVDTLFRRLIWALDDSAITVRAAAVRAIDNVVSADHRILGVEQIRSAIERRMTDSGTMVRSSIVDLLGKHMHKAEFANQYYKSILERISDVGVSVRKRVINILHSYLETLPNMSIRIEILRTLAFRISDDDTGVQELVVRIFRGLWLSQLPASNHVCQLTDAETTDFLSERAEHFVNVLWDVFCSVSRTGLAKLPLLPTFPIVAILRRTLSSSEDDAATLWKGDRKGTKDSIDIIRANDMCNSILNGLLLQEEYDGGREDALEVPFLIEDTQFDRRSYTLSFPRAVRYALGLHVFCVADRKLLVGDVNPTALVTALHPYLKRCENNPANAIQLQCCLSVIDAVVEEVGCLSFSSACELEKDLRCLLLRSTYHGVLYYAARCICSTSKIDSGTGALPGALQICYRFVKMLNEVCIERELSNGEHAHVARALFVLGHLARFGAETFENYGDREVSPTRLLHIFRSFLQRTSRQEFDLKKSALRACGLLFVSRPCLMLSAKGDFGKGSMDGIMCAALSTSAECGLKEQALLNLEEYLREEESRALIRFPVRGDQTSQTKYFSHDDVCNDGLVNLHGGKTENLQTVNGEYDNSLANGVAQRYWSDVIELSTDPEPSVRLKALHLVEIVLRQGLVHPMSCFPPLIALQIDPVVTVRKLAFRLLKQQRGKHPEFFDHQLNLALELLFDYCKRIRSAVKSMAKERQRNVDLLVSANICFSFYCLFSSIFPLFGLSPRAATRAKSSRS